MAGYMNWKDSGKTSASVENFSCHGSIFVEGDDWS